MLLTRSWLVVFEEGVFGARHEPTEKNRGGSARGVRKWWRQWLAHDLGGRPAASRRRLVAGPAGRQGGAEGRREDERVLLVGVSGKQREREKGLGLGFCKFICYWCCSFTLDHFYLHQMSVHSPPYLFNFFSPDIFVSLTLIFSYYNYK